MICGDSCCFITFSNADRVSQHDLVPKEENATVIEYLKKIYGIREVLKRDHMKVSVKL